MTVGCETCGREFDPTLCEMGSTGPKFAPVAEPTSCGPCNWGQYPQSRTEPNPCDCEPCGEARGGKA